MSDLPASEISAFSSAAQRHLESAVNGQRAFVLTVLVFVAAISLALPNPVLLTSAALLQFLLFLIVSAIYGLLVHIVAHFIASRSLDAGIHHGLKTILATANISRGAPTLVAIAVFVFSFATFKAQIPNLNPYSWDPALAELDRIVHFGKSPWLWLAGVTGYGGFTRFIDHVYYLWFPITFGAAAVAALTPGNSTLRHRFLLSFVLCWIFIGCLFAAALSSVGPIYYDLVSGGPSEFTGLIAQLESVDRLSPLKALDVRDMLWLAYTGESQSIVSGISAMPSMHNAVCVLLFLAARHISSRLAAAAVVYALLIFIGSVHLGWHYAIDGYVSAILVALIWKTSGYIVECQNRAIAKGR